MNWLTNIFRRGTRASRNKSAYAPPGRRAPQLEMMEDRTVPAVVGGLDPSFGTGGRSFLPDPVTLNDTFADVALQADGGIVAVGTTVQPTGAHDFLIARFKPDGTVDAAFNGGAGRQIIDFGGYDQAHGVAIQPDGKIVVVGQGAGEQFSASFCVARLNPDGTRDGSFGNNNGLNWFDLGDLDIPNDVGIQSDGTIVVAGSSYLGATGHSDFMVIRVGPTGALAEGPARFDFGPGANDAAFALAIHGPGVDRDKIVVVGTGDATSDLCVVRLDANLANPAKRSFPLGNTDAARAVAIQPDGRILVGGESNWKGTSDFAIIRLTADLALDPTFNAGGVDTGVPGYGLYDMGGQESAAEVLLQPDGRIVLVGTYLNTAAPDGFALLRVNPDGTRDPSFNPTGRSQGQVIVPLLGGESASAAALDPNGRVVVAGSTTALFSGRLATLVRVIGGVEKGPRLAIGGSEDGLARVLASDFTTGRYNAAPAALNPFGVSGVNVRTGIGDVNGDFVPDAVLATGPGTPFQVAVVSGQGNGLLAPPFYPFGIAFTQGGFVATADFDLDGRAEFVVTPDVGGGPRVTIFSVLGGSVVTRNNYLTVDPDFRGGVRVGAGDINGDGVPDLAVSAGFGGGPRIVLFDGRKVLTTDGWNPADKLQGTDFYAFSHTLRDGAYVAVGDVDGDGFADLVFGAGDGGGPNVRVVSGRAVMTDGGEAAALDPLASFYSAGSVDGRGGVRVAVTDVDGDRMADVVTGSGKGQPARARAYLGKDVRGTTEPWLFQDLDAYGRVALSDGVFVG